MSTSTSTVVARHNKKPLHLGLGLFREKLCRCNYGLSENVKWCSVSPHREGRRKLDVSLWENIWCLQRECDGLRRLQLVRLSDGLPGASVSTCLSMWVCLCAGVLAEPMLVACKPDLLSYTTRHHQATILIDPHLFRMAPNPDNLSSGFSSQSNPSLPHVVWPTGQASCYLLCLCRAPLLPILAPEIWTSPCPLHTTPVWRLVI